MPNLIINLREKNSHKLLEDMRQLPQSVLQSHISIGLLLNLVSGLQQRDDVLIHNGLLVHSLHQAAQFLNQVGLVPLVLEVDLGRKGLDQDVGVESSFEKGHEEVTLFPDIIIG
jgi:hypothetical protein